MLLRIKLATSGFVPENNDVDFLNTYFDVDPVEEDDEETDRDNDENERDDEDDIPDDESEIHRIDEESRRLDEIYYGVR